MATQTHYLRSHRYLPRYFAWMSGRSPTDRRRPPQCRAVLRLGSFANFEYLPTFNLHIVSFHVGTVRVSREMIPVANESERVRIPHWLVVLESFRRWVDAADFPDDGRGWYLKDEVWIDMSKEQIFPHLAVTNASRPWGP